MVAFFGLVCVAIAQGRDPAVDKWQAPPDAADKPNPEAQNPAAPTAGRKIFIRFCVNCHGETGSGQGTGAADLRCPEAQGQSDGALFWKITNGNTSNGMPAFGALPETARWDVVSFLRTLKEPDGDCSKGSGGTKTRTRFGNRNYAYLCRR
jgi:mono/diheme cytochrome c family protein